MRTAPVISEANKEFFSILTEVEIEALAGIQAKLLKQDAPGKHHAPRTSGDASDSHKTETAPRTAPGRSLEEKPLEEKASLKRLQRARVAFDAQLISETEFESEKRRFLEGSPD
jgi:hypothetical protein